MTNIDEGVHLGLWDVPSPEELARVKRSVVEVVAPEGSAVLNAADPLVAAMAGHCAGRVIDFMRGDGADVVARHRVGGGWAVVARDGAILLAVGDREIELTRLDEVLMMHGGQIGFQVENALAAVAAAWSLDLPLEAIRARIGSFTADSGQAPAQFNRIDAGGATIILDYGHNAGALVALIEALNALPHPRRTIAFTGASDHRNADLTRQGTLLSDAFDRVVLFEDRGRRSRSDGEVIALIRAGLDVGVRVGQVAIAPNEADAIPTALRGIGSGDLVVIPVDESAEETLAAVRSCLVQPGPETGGLATGEIWTTAHPHQTLAWAEPARSALRTRVDP